MITSRRCWIDALSSLRDFVFWLDDLPSHKWLGYSRRPTQNPVALLERIIQAGSHPDDVVLDPFCGCGTTIDAAEKHGEQKELGV
ncbi:MAG: hypothetical protein KGR98_14665 [Verrucomicrobia bacterium]|nr:hypothetical protein [Verrucomicrobiota bacterium]